MTDQSSNTNIGSASPGAAGGTPATGTRRRANSKVERIANPKVARRKAAAANTHETFSVPATATTMQQGAHSSATPATAAAAASKGSFANHGVVASFEGQFQRAAAIGHLLAAKGSRMMLGLPASAVPAEVAAHLFDNYLDGIEAKLADLQLV